jgi:hypothetical protein
MVPMEEEATKRFEMVIRQGAPHGDLYELEQTTYYQVVDRLSGQVVMVFESEMEASLSRDTGLWDDYRFGGVSDVTIAPDEWSVTVTYLDGREEVLSLPEVAGPELDPSSAEA